VRTIRSSRIVAIRLEQGVVTSFQAYLDNAEKQTGVTPRGFLAACPNCDRWGTPV
jgi:hypothetical protein